MQLRVRCRRVVVVKLRRCRKGRWPTALSSTQRRPPGFDIVVIRQVRFLVLELLIKVGGYQPDTRVTTEMNPMFF